jgi:hypothetical protein
MGYNLLRSFLVSPSPQEGRGTGQPLVNDGRWKHRSSGKPFLLPPLHQSGHGDFKVGIYSVLRDPVDIGRCGNPSINQS